MMLNFHFSLESYYLFNDTNWTTTFKNHGENFIILKISLLLKDYLTSQISDLTVLIS